MILTFKPVCVCARACVYDREGEREIGGGGEKRGERIRYEIIIAI